MILTSKGLKLVIDILETIERQKILFSKAKKND